MPSVVGTMTKGAVFDAVVNVVDVGSFTTMDEKVTPVDADLLVIADSATSYTRKKVQIGNLPGGGSGAFQHRWTANGPYIVGTDVDGAYISDSAFTVSGVWLYRGTAGSASSTIVDIHKNGTTLYTTQGNRPTIAYDDTDKKVDCTLPDVVAIAAGDIITMDIDQKETGSPKDLMIIIQGA
jgi:hypothetical protein